MRVKKLGMSRSLFERYFKLHNKRVVMLDTQYRMVSILSLPLSPPLSHVVLLSLISPPLSHVVPPSHLWFPRVTGLRGVKYIFQILGKQDSDIGLFVRHISMLAVDSAD